MTRSLAGIIGQYKQILKEDGAIDKNELIEMLKLDKDLSVSDIKYEIIADKILETKVTTAERVLELYQKGMMDAEISKELNRGIGYIRLIRGKLNLPALPNKSLEEREGKVIALYQNGLKDDEIAKALDLTPRQVRGIRYKNKLYKPKAVIFDTDKAYELYLQGLNDRQISEAVGVSRVSVYNWRIKKKLQQRSKSKTKTK